MDILTISHLVPTSSSTCCTHLDHVEVVVAYGRLQRLLLQVRVPVAVGEAAPLRQRDVMVTLRVGAVHDQQLGQVDVAEVGGEVDGARADVSQLRVGGE